MLDQQICNAIQHLPSREFIQPFLRINPLQRKDLQAALEDTFFQSVLLDTPFTHMSKFKHVTTVDQHEICRDMNLLRGII